MSSQSTNLPGANSLTLDQSRVEIDADRRESRLRLSIATVMLLGVYEMLFGMAWDGQWHAAVGRDQFFTPPHILMYTGASAIGLLCLIMVFVETIRFRRRSPGVNEQTTKVLGIFHAPLDNYWHTLYGIDVTVWSPFHLMGLLSGLIAFLGIVYLFGSEATRARQQRMSTQGAEATRSERGFHLTEILLMLSLVVLLPVDRRRLGLAGRSLCYLCSFA